GPRENEIASWIEQSGAGWIVPEGDVDALLGVVAAARDAAERERRGRSARAFATQHFSLERSCARLVELLVRSAPGAPNPQRRR
ncbi:MAG TPA: hypothetical protein VK576_07325, partial [Thermoleophilia bacterium]|nr:hypothetical protein [Thermoleophilia bacterium]